MTPSPPGGERSCPRRRPGARGGRGLGIRCSCPRNGRAPLLSGTSLRVRAGSQCTRRTRGCRGMARLSHRGRESNGRRRSWSCCTWTTIGAPDSQKGAPSLRTRALASAPATCKSHHGPPQVLAVPVVGRRRGSGVRPAVMDGMGGEKTRGGGGEEEGRREEGGGGGQREQWRKEQAGGGGSATQFSNAVQPRSSATQEGAVRRRRGYRRRLSHAVQQRSSASIAAQPRRMLFLFMQY